MGASTKGVSSKQLERMLGVTYKSAWFMSMRLREAMTDEVPTGGIGGRVGGEMRASHVADVTTKTLRETLVTQANRKSDLMTDEAHAYKGVGKEFSGHGSVNHSADEYAFEGNSHGI
jgi:hypothetical protein